MVDTDGEPLRQAVRAEPDLVSPNVLEAEELVGHEFAGDEERSPAVAEIAAMGPREAIMTLPDGCFAQVMSTVRRCSSARASSRASRSRSAVRAMPSSPATWRRAMKAAPPDQCLRFGVACGAESTGRLGAGLIDAREARRLMGDVELSVIELPPRSAETGADSRAPGGRSAAGDVAAQEHQVAGEQRRARRRGRRPTAEWPIGAQSVGVRSSPCQLWNCSVSR